MVGLEESFAPVIGLPSWSVERGRPSPGLPGIEAMVFLEFGEPVLTVGDPRMWPTYLDRAPEATLGRRTFLRGTWHLTLMTCDWQLSLDGHTLATSRADESCIDRGLDVLNGQRLTAVHTRRGEPGTSFQFDLGCVLDIGPDTTKDADGCVSELWILNHLGTYLTVRAGSTYSIRPKSVLATESVWLPIA